MNQNVNLTLTFIHLRVATQTRKIPVMNQKLWAHTMIMS